jgi:two-component system response regulator NreC
MKKVKILIADDHHLVRTGLMNLLEPIEAFTVVGEAEDGEDAIEKTGALMPDVVILDLSMPKVSGIEATKQILKKYPTVKILVLTMHDNEEYVYQIFKSGASGYILKNSTKDELADAIRAVSKGEKYFSSKVSEIMVQGYVKRAEERDGRPSGAQVGDKELLTNREREVLGLVAEGMTNQQISERLFISPRTVETHKTNIMQKLDIHDSAKLVKYAVEWQMNSKNER